MTFKEFYQKANKNTFITARITVFGIKMSSRHSAEYWNEDEHELENKKIIDFYTDEYGVIVNLENE